MDKSLLKPKYWYLWIIFGFSRLRACLPYKFQMKSAVFIGRLFKPLLKRRRMITVTNLKIAFPEKSENEIKILANKCYDSLWMAGSESIMAWFRPKKSFDKINYTIKNEEYLLNEINNPNRGILLVGEHFHCLEICGRMFGERYKNFGVLYRKHSNPLMEYMITSSREKYIKTFERSNLRKMIFFLKKKGFIWYAPDQDLSPKNSVFVPFFGKQCSTLKVAPWIVKNSKAVLIPISYVRKDDLSGYEFEIHKPWDNFPSGDDYTDARRYNEFLEGVIKEHPEQYLWQHRRFKTRPKGEEKIY